MTIDAIVKDEIGKWLKGTLLMCVVSAVCVAGLWALGEDWKAPVVFVLEHVPSVLFGIVVLSGGVLFVDAITKGDYFERIADNSMACAVFCTAIVLGLVCIICFS